MTGLRVQTNVVRQDGQRGVLSHDSQSRNSIDAECRLGNQTACCRALRRFLPPEMKITPLADQSVFVRSAISGVVREGDHRRGADRL